MFSGLRSRWTTPFSCAAARPCATCCAILITLASGSVPLRRMHLRQRLAFHERHRQVLDAVDLAEVVDADDVLVGDLARQHELALEALLELLRRGRVRLRGRTDHLDRHRDAELVIERLIDGAHAAGAEQLQDRVARVDLLPGLERSITGANRRARRRTVERGRDAGGADRRRVSDAGSRRCNRPRRVAAGVGGRRRRKHGFWSRRRRGRRTRSREPGVPQFGQNPASCGTEWPHFTHDGSGVRPIIWGDGGV